MKEDQSLYHSATFLLLSYITSSVAMGIGNQLDSLYKKKSDVPYPLEAASGLRRDEAGW